MPNHVTNRITAAPQVIAAMTRHYTDAEIAKIDSDYVETCRSYKERTGNEWPYPKKDTSQRIVDFSLVIPEPANIFHGGCDGNHPHRDEDGNPMVCWYGWNVNNWGTKWNAYDYSVGATNGDLAYAEFDTAWSHPEKVVYTLAEKFPDEELIVEFADEDTGFNFGKYRIQGDEVEDLIPDIVPGSDEACRWSMRMRGYDEGTVAELMEEMFG